MGMRILPNYTFETAPTADVLVVPGGSLGAVRDDPQVIDWIRRSAATADYVMSTCTGALLLARVGLLDGRQATTWYRQVGGLRELVPDAHVLESEEVVPDGKIVTSNGTGLDASLQVLALLHGEAWANVVRLNMEYEPIPTSERTPRAELADLGLPDAIYSRIPSRNAELLAYKGDRNHWLMHWRFASPEPLEALAGDLREGMQAENGWILFQ